MISKGQIVVNLQIVQATRSRLSSVVECCIFLLGHLRGVHPFRRAPTKNHKAKPLPDLLDHAGRRQAGREIESPQLNAFLAPFSSANHSSPDGRHNCRWESGIARKQQHTQLGKGGRCCRCPFRRPLHIHAPDPKRILSQRNNEAKSVAGKIWLLLHV